MKISLWTIMKHLKVNILCCMLHNCIPYSLDQTPRLLFTSSPEFVRGLLMPVTAREAMFREMVDWHHWSRRFWPLCWCRRLELVLSCTYHQNKYVHVLIFSNSRRGAATIREWRLFRSAHPEVRWLIKSSIWSGKYGTCTFMHNYYDICKFSE